MLNSDVYWITCEMVVTCDLLCWITTILACMLVGLKSLVISLDYQSYMGSSARIWSFRWLFLYLCSYNLDGSVTNTVSKWTKMWFHMTHVIFLYWVSPKQFSKLWYVQRKLCTYLMSRLALSPNGPKRASTWVSSPKSTIGCVQNDFWAYGTFGVNRVPILHRHKHCLQTDWNEMPLDPSPRSSVGCVQNDF
jgi:hypothetical protein